MSEADRLREEIERLQKAGVTLPRNPIRKAQAANDMHNMSRAARHSAFEGLDVSLGQMTTEEEMRRTRDQIRDFGTRRQANMRKLAGVGGDVGAAIPRFYDPLEYWDITGLPWNVANEGHRHKLHKWLRLYYATHYLVPILVDIFTRFPLVGMELESKDPQIKSFYEDLFFDQLDYSEFLVHMGREFWCVGEAFPLASFDENLGVWEAEELLNPADIIVENFPLLRTTQLKVSPPDSLKQIAQTRQPPREWRMLEVTYPELIPYLRRGDHIPISGTLLKHVGNKLNSWDDHGTPILLRGLRTLLHEEKLLASQDAIAERLYSPLILAKAGIMDFGDNQPPWIPGPDELDAIRDDFDIALASDFRLIVHNIGLEVSNVFGREQMPRLGDDFDRIERRLMQVFGVNPSLLSAGSNSQPYASSALQAEFLNQILKTFQNRLVKHFKERAAVVAEAQGHFDYITKGQTRVPVMEHVVEINEDGTKRVRERPKLLIPDLKFRTLDLRDEATERKFLQELRGMGVPIPDTKLSIGISWAQDTTEMTKEYNEEIKTKTIAQQRAKMETYTALKAQGLPVPADLKAEVESVLGIEQGAMGAGGSAPGGAMPPGASGPPTGPGGSSGPGGPIAMPPLPGGDTGVPGGGPPTATPASPGPAGTVPDVSNERRPGLTYNTNTHVASSEEAATIEEPFALGRYQSLEDEGTEKERVVEKTPKPDLVYVSKANQERKYSIIDPDAEPLNDEKAIAEQVVASINESGGITIKLSDATQPTSGFAFAPDKASEVRVDPATFGVGDVENFIDANRDALHAPGNYLGAWRGTIKNDPSLVEYIFLDVSQVIDDRNEALKLAGQADQEAIFDLESFEEIEVPRHLRPGSDHPADPVV